MSSLVLLGLSSQKMLDGDYKSGTTNSKLATEPKNTVNRIKTELVYELVCRAYCPPGSLFYYLENKIHFSAVTEVGGIATVVRIIKGFCVMDAPAR